MMDCKLKTCCFTGHRKIPPENFEEISRRLEATLIKLIEKGYRYFGAGGALGFDTLAAQTVLKLKTVYPHIKLILVLPCKDQTSRWRNQEIEEYERIKAAADKVVYISEHYFDGCMLKRNRHLVDNSSCCICYLKKETGGTAYTVNYAKEKMLAVYNVAEALTDMTHSSAVDIL